MVKRTKKPEISPGINMPAVELLEHFCLERVGLYNPASAKRELTVAQLVTEFKGAFGLSIPVVTQLYGLLKRLDIDLIGFEETPGIDATFDYDYSNNKWRIHVRNNAGLGESKFILHELFEIIFWRCFHLIDWWQTWMQRSGISDPHQLADDFAMFVIFPKIEFGHRAFACGLNPWTISHQFQAYAGDSLNAMTRQLSMPCQYYQIRLDVTVDSTHHDILQFEDNGTLAKVVSKGSKSSSSPSTSGYKLLATIKSAFPKKGAVIETIGSLFEALAKPTSSVQELDIINYTQLSEPVCVVTRPDERNGGTASVQFVPTAYRYLLMDDQLRECTEAKFE